MNSSYLIPCKMCCVKVIHKPENGLGFILNVTTDNIETSFLVFFPKLNEKIWLKYADLACGFAIGMIVKNIPSTITRKSLGVGKVIRTRKIKNIEQVLVDFFDSGKKVWLPYQVLAFVRDIDEKFYNQVLEARDNAKYFIIRNLAYALELWHQNTGSLSHLDIDPLPHQIHLVHHILNSGNYNWLIADDVGLGKTIEVGLLISALMAREIVHRVLVVTPASLTSQWRDELKYRFNMNHFEIYGIDFKISDLTHWDKHDFVIASIDVIKNDKHLHKIKNSGHWDLIVFDEAHKLTRVRFGDQYKSTQRFRLAAQLRKLTNYLILLSATPHQGKQDKFIALLELIRPDLKRQLLNLYFHPEIVKDLIFRNSKSEVIDLDGNFIFNGKETFRIKVELSKKEKKFDEYLKNYLKKGYKASETEGNKYGRAIGFVMTTFRKLAASSYPAIINALDKRLKKLLKNSPETSNKMFKLFFKNEINELQNIISIAKDCLINDSKINSFMTILENITQSNPKEKIVVFTEYKATQNYLKNKIEEFFGKNSVSLINGSMNINERLKAIDDFEDKHRFLISTEAGGEGINLQRKCHIMINYDLPWNPMRLVQRIGRLYRYGQKNVVKVFNITTSDTIDGYLTDLLYSRIEQIVKDMSIVNNDYKPGLEAEILGEFCELVEIADILNSSESLNKTKTERDITYALQKAKEALEKQRDILVHASSFSAKDTTEGLPLNIKHLEKFCFYMFELVGIEIAKVTHNNTVYELKLPDELKEELGFHSKNIRISFIKDAKLIRKGILLMDINNPLLRMLFEKAKSPGFGGL